MTDEITFTLKENPAGELYELLKDIDVEKTPAFTISDTHGNIAEYVKVIRCKDCKHRPTIDGEWENGFNVIFPDGRCPCQCNDGWYNWMPDDDWYCGNAERKEE